MVRWQRVTRCGGADPAGRDGLCRVAVRAPAGPDAELQRLRRENDLLKQERAFLQKAAAPFAKDAR